MAPSAMSGLARLLRIPELKASRVASLIALEPGRPRWTPRDYAALAREGYAANPVVHRCVRLIAEAAASVLWRVYDRRARGARPRAGAAYRPAQSAPERPGLPRVAARVPARRRQRLCRERSASGTVRELHLLRPDRIKVVPGPDGWPAAFDYTVNGTTLRLQQSEDAIPPVLHLALFHPLDDHYGLAPAEAAAKAIDIHNAALGWNKALLDNAARPSGALVCAGEASLSESQFERLKASLRPASPGR